MNKILSLEEVAIFLEIITLVYKENPPFDIDFLVEKTFNHPYPSCIIQAYIVQTVLCFYGNTEVWSLKVIEMIVKILNFKEQKI